MSSPDPRTVGSYLSKGGSALSSVAPYLVAVSGPAGAAVGILGALAGIAGDVLQGQRVTATRAEDPGPLLDAMHAHWAAKKAVPR